MPPELTTLRTVRSPFSMARSGDWKAASMTVSDVVAAARLRDILAGLEPPG
jgi:hypothetical protein